MVRNFFKLSLIIAFIAIPARLVASSESNDEPEYRRKKCKKFCRIIAESARICGRLDVGSLVAGSASFTDLTVGGIPFGSSLGFGGVAKITDPVVAAGAAIQFDYLAMPSFNETPTATGLTLTNAGTYFYLFKVLATPAGLSTPFSVTLYSNGAAVPGASARSERVTAPATEGQAIGAGIATFPAGAALSLVNTGTQSFTLGPVAGDPGSVAFLVTLRLS